MSQHILSLMVAAVIAMAAFATGLWTAQQLDNEPVAATEPRYSLECEEAVKSFFRELNSDVPDSSVFDSLDSEQKEHYRQTFEGWTEPFCP